MRFLYCWRPVAFVLVGLVALVGCQPEEPFPTAAEEDQLRGLLSVKRPPPSPTNRFAEDARAAALGERLFFDPALSGCQTVSCASCHPAPDYADAEPLSQGCNGTAGRHTPTVLNVAFGSWFMWDGRADSLWAQALLPLFDPAEMGADPQTLPKYLGEHYPEYRDLFGTSAEVEPDPNRVFSNVGKSIEAYIRTLVEVESPFDARLRQFLQAASDGRAEEDPFYLPLKTFVRDGGCISCHEGPMLSDQDFHNIGVEDPKKDRGRIASRDVVTGSVFSGEGAYSDDPVAGHNRLQSLRSRPTEDEEGAFKTPTLRNITRTAPYMHTGTLKTLEEVIDLYDRGGDPDGTFSGVRAVSIKPLELTPQQKAALLDLLQSLSPAPAP